MTKFTTESADQHTSQNLTWVTTADGSKTIYNNRVGENYHSKHGALQESLHVFINAGLKHWLTGNPNKQVSVLEVGLGTGLNFLLSADYCTNNQINLNYTGIEAYPLSTDMISQTGYEQYIDRQLWDNFLDNYPSSINHMIKVNNYCSLKTAHSTLNDFNSAERYDVLYFDAFAAVHQPEMWNYEAINHIVKFLNPGGVFVTYAITGELKRIFKNLGFMIEKVPGAPGKREMLRTTKPLV